MVSIPHGVHAPELTPLTSPRDWSHKWDGHEPPTKGEYCYCVMLIGVRKKQNWQPRTADAQVPDAFILGTMADWWGRHLWIVERDAREFNMVQMRRLSKPKFRITLWAMPAYGVCGFYETVRLIRKELGGETSSTVYAGDAFIGRATWRALGRRE